MSYPIVRAIIAIAGGLFVVLLLINAWGLFSNSNTPGKLIVLFFVIAAFFNIWSSLNEGYADKGSAMKTISEGEN
jgi:hypothetical protein